MDYSSDIVNGSSQARPHIKGKFFYQGDKKFWVRGVTYGTFRPDESGNEFHRREVVAADFSQMAANGINAIRTYTPPPPWLLDNAWQQGLFVMVGLPWEQHVAFLDNRKTARDIESRLREMIRKIAGHPALLCYVIGNEIPASIVRWHGRKRVERFLVRLYIAAKAEDPDALVTYVNYPTTEYLQLPFLDFCCYNVYLEDQKHLEAYLYRLQNIAGDRPLVLGEVGLDSRRNGVLKQASVIDWQIRTAYHIGCGGVFVFGWTDGWYRGGSDIDDWDFGLTDRRRRPKAALIAVRKAYAEVPFPSDVAWPKITIIVCTYNGRRTIGECCQEFHKLDYPNKEVIIVDDGSTDGTYKIVGQNGFRVIRTENAGLSAARNLGLEAASGEIVAYIDDDAYPDPHWLKYLAITFLTTDCAGAGGPNIPPPGDGKTAACIANAPGGPMHILISDREAEHLPGCNMAFRRDHLKAIGGFDVRFRAAGDDVDVCWRIQERGWWLAFSPGAVVWHHRRNSVRAYLRQQKGYGRAEALLERKWPDKYNALGHLNWKGKIYGKGPTKAISWRRWRIYHGTWGGALFQSLYGPSAGFLASWPVMPEWYILNAILLIFSLTGVFWKPMLLAVPLLMVTAGLSLISVVRSAVDSSLTRECGAASGGLKAVFLTGWLHAMQPLVRLYGRLGCGLTPWRRRGPGRFRLPKPHTYVIWSERWRSSQRWLESIEKALQRQGAIVRRGGDFDHWDLEIRGGLFGAARSRMAIEEHGSGRQLIRLKVWPQISCFATLSALVLTILSALAAIDQALAAALVLGLATILQGSHLLADCASARAACHETVSGIIRSTSSERSDMSTDRDDSSFSVAQSNSSFDPVAIDKGAEFSASQQRLILEAEQQQG
jgi:GT2 family glycosyltransferase